MRNLDVSMANRIYLDNAATTWPKPEAVYAAVENAMRELGAPAGRGAYEQAAIVEREISRTRSNVAELLGVSESRRVVFTQNGTDSLNTALHGLLRPGNHVVATAIEHNSVLRPLQWLRRHRDITFSLAPCNSHGEVNADDIRKAVTPETRLICLNHASNVTGAVSPAVEVGKLAREREVFYLLDAAQTLGCVDFDFSASQADLIAAPGHKGLLGPLGSGVLYIGPRVEAEMTSLRQGGTGTQSFEDQQPETLPDKFESGNHNVPALLGLGAGARWVSEQTVAAISAKCRELTLQLLAGLEAMSGVKVVGPTGEADRVSVVSVTLENFDPQEAAAMLDSAASVQTRAGFHCAPLIHRALGTADSGGTLRFSVGPFNTAEDIETALATLEQLAAL